MKPPSQLIKADCDSSLHGNGFVGIGFFVRDSEGEILLDRLLGNIFVNCAETWPIRKAMI